MEFIASNGSVGRAVGGNRGGDVGLGRSRWTGSGCCDTVRGVTNEFGFGQPPDGPSGKQARAGSPASSAALVLLLVMLGILGYIAWQYATPAPEARPVSPRGELASDEKSTIELFQSASPSVAYITRLNEARGPFRNVETV